MLYVQYKIIFFIGHKNIKNCFYLIFHTLNTYIQVDMVKMILHDQNYKNGTARRDAYTVMWDIL